MPGSIRFGNIGSNRLLIITADGTIYAYQNANPAPVQYGQRVEAAPPVNEVVIPFYAGDTGIASSDVFELKFLEHTAQEVLAGLAATGIRPGSEQFSRIVSLRMQERLMQVAGNQNVVQTNGMTLSVADDLSVVFFEGI